MEKWNDVKNKITSISESEKRAIEILAALEVDFDEEKIKLVKQMIEEYNETFIGLAKR